MIAIARRPATAPIAVLAAALGLLLVALLLREPITGNPAKPATPDGYSPVQTVTLQPAPAAPASDQASGAQQEALPSMAAAPPSTAGQPPAAASAPAAQAQIATTAPPQADNQQLPPNSRVPTTDPSSGGGVPPNSR